jgi:NAD-dependent SIR2 family protein deacetylase
MVDDLVENALHLLAIDLGKKETSKHYTTTNTDGLDRHNNLAHNGVFI